MASSVAEDKTLDASLLRDLGRDLSCVSNFPEPALEMAELLLRLGMNRSAA